MINLSKITAPSTPGILHRKRLFNLLDDYLENQAVWISSPGGSGKTSLVASYIAERKPTSLWYNIDAGDSDVATFFYYMGFASQKAAQGKKKPMPLLTPEYLHGINVFTQRYFEELFKRLKTPSVIVLDNYHEVAEETYFHEAVNIALSNLPPGIKVIVISRYSPPQVFSRLRINNLIKKIGWDDIRLTEDETRELMHRKNSDDLDEEVISLLQRKTEGWVAGLVLLMENAKQHRIDYHLLDFLTQDDIFPYFASEILRKTDRNTQEFLLKTSFLPSMTAQMAESLTGVRSAGKILQDLYEQNYFTERRLEHKPIYQYHALFRDFLKTNAQTYFPDEVISEVRKNAASLLMETGQVDDAAALLIDSRDWEAFIPFVVKHAPFLLTLGRNMALSGWIEQIPKSLSSSHPWLHYWAGESMLFFNPEESRSLFIKAFDIFNELKHAEGILASWAGIVDTFLIELKDFRPLDQWIAWFDANKDAYYRDITNETKAKVAVCMTGALVWTQPSHPDTKYWLETSLELVKKHMTGERQVRAYIDIFLYYAWIGECTQGAVIVEELRKITSEPSASPIMQIMSKLAVSYLYSSYTDLSALSLESVAEGLDIGEKTGIHAIDYHLLSAGARGALMDRNMILSEKYLTDMEKASINEFNLKTSLYYHLAGYSEWLQGNIPQSIFLSRTSIQLIEHKGAVILESFYRILHAGALCEEGEFEQAENHIRILDDTASPIGSSYVDYQCLLLKAYHALTRKDRPLVLKHIRSALKLGKENPDMAGMINIMPPAPISQLYAIALEQNIHTGFVRDLIKRNRMTPLDAFMETESWPWPVKIHTLGQFVLSIDGESVNVSGKSQKKPLMMLKALISHGGRDIKEEQLTDIIWPEAEGDAGHNAFTTTLSRLRKLIRHEQAIHLTDGRISLDHRLCWIDRWAFERLSSKAESLFDSFENNQGDIHELRHIVEKAEQLYEGSFLHSDTDLPWTISTRERLRSRYYRLISQMARVLSQTGDHDAAISYYRKGLDAEPLSEELHQGLITAYINMDRLAEALAAFKQCRKILGAQSIPLSPRTEALKKQIQKP